MRIGGFTKQSFIDWAGKTAAVIFTKGCNFRCTYCHNPSLVLPELIAQEPDVNIETIFQYLEQRTNWLDGVVVTGGEPTLHTDLPNFLEKIKKLGYKIKLDTNGAQPIVLKKLIDNQLINFVAMDIKTCLESQKYEAITRIQDKKLIEKIHQSLELLSLSNIQYQLRTTLLPNHHSEQDIDNLKKQFKQKNYTLQQFRKGDIVGNYCK